MNLRVSGVRFTPASDALRATGLEGWVSVLLNDAVRADGIGLRRSRDGVYGLSYPLAADGVHYVMRPINSDARRSIERQVFEHLDLDTRGGR